MEIPLTVLRWKSRLWVYFKIESVLQAKRKKNLLIANEEMSREQLKLTFDNFKYEEGQGDY